MDESKNPLTLIEACCDALEGNYGTAIETGGVILFVIIFNILSRFVIRNLRLHFLNKNKLLPLSLFTALEKPLNYFVWIVAFFTTIDILSEGIFGSHPFEMHKTLNICAVLSLGWFLLRWNKSIGRCMIEMSEKHEIEVPIGKLDLISKLGTVAVGFFTLFLLADVTGSNMQTLIAFGGIGGLALAFASQQVISNFFGGTMIYLTQPFSIGERVFLPEKNIEGHIEEIGWYLTRLRNLEKRPIYVPNSIFAQTIVITPSRTSHERIKFTIGLRYEDIKVIKNVVDEIKLMLLKHPHIDQQVKTEVFFTNFGDSSLDIDISTFMSVSSGMEFLAVKQEILLKVAEIVTKNGAVIATPTNIVEIQGNLFKNHDLTLTQKLLPQA